MLVKTACLVALAPLVVLFLLDDLFFKWNLGRKYLWTVLSKTFPILIFLASTFLNDTYGSCVFSFDASESNRNRIALTIDDCPGDSIKEMILLLDTLKEFGAKVTFFCTTNYIINGGDKMIELMKRIVADGHELGNHLPEDKPYWDHPAHVFASELERAERVLEDIDNVSTHNRWFRPPSGKLSKAMSRVLKLKGYKGIAMANVFSNDVLIGGSVDPPSEWDVQYHANFNAQADPGSIVVFHCPQKRSRRQVRFILRKLLKDWTTTRNLDVVTLSTALNRCSAVDQDGIGQ